MPRRAVAPPAAAYQRALRRLARRDHSVAELRRALLERGHDAAEVEAALERLRGERYLDDAGFAERFARSRLAHQGLGRLRIRQGLRQRGWTGARPRPGSPGRCARWTSGRSSTGWPAATGASTPGSSRRGGSPACGPSCCGGASRPRWCTSASRRSGRGGSDALEGLEPVGAGRGPRRGERVTRASRPSGAHGEDGRRDPQRVPPLLRGARAPGGEELAPRAPERPHPPLRERGDEPVQGRLPRAGEAGLHPRRLLAEVRPRRGQAQRPRERGGDRAPPHLLRDARQLLLRRLLQEGRDRVRLGASSPATSASPRTA